MYNLQNKLKTKLVQIKNKEKFYTITDIKKASGITLIALVITIVVLLILASITLSYTIGDNGIIKEAQNAKNETIEKTANIENDRQGLISEISGEDRLTKQKISISTDLSSSDITASSFTLNIGVTYSDYEISKIEWFYKLSSDDTYSTITDTYTSSRETTDKSVLTESKSHTFSGLSGGNYSVFAIVYDVAGNSKQSSTISVYNGVVFLSYNDLNLYRGTSGSPSLSYSGAPKSIEYSSSDTSIAIVNASGLITASAYNTGTVTITATATNYDGTTVSIENTVSVISGIARVNNIDYSSLQNAVNAVFSGTIILLKSTTENVTIWSDRDVIIDLNEQTLNGGILVAKTLTIKNGTVSQSNGYALTAGYEESTINILSGTYYSSSNEGICCKENATINISGGIVQGKYNGIVHYGTGSINISGGKVIGNESHGIHTHSTGSVNVYGGTVEGNDGIYSSGSGTILIDGGTVNGTNGGGIYCETGNIIVKNGTVQGTNYGIQNYGEGSILIYGGNIISTKYDGIATWSTGAINIDAGIIQGNATGIHIYGNTTLTITGGSILGNVYYGVDVSIGRLNMNGGSITGKTHGIYNDTGIVNMNGGTVRGETDGIRMDGNGIVNLNYGTSTGHEWGICANSGNVYYRATTMGSDLNYWDNGRYAVYAINHYYIDSPKND